MTSILVSKFYDLLSADGFLLQENVFPEAPTNKIARHALGAEVEEVYTNLGGKSDWTKIKVPGIDLWANDYFISIDERLQFNRYRAATLGANFYLDATVFTKEQYVRYCRQFEPECKKAGKAKAFWTSPEAVHHFGEADPAGEFFDGGSPAWKLRAMQAMLLDISAHLSKLKYIRISCYGNLMTGGQLERLDKFFLKSDEASIKVQTQWLKRTLEKLD